MSAKKYHVLNLNGEKAYVRKDRLRQLKRVDAVVFDCDGVLIDIRGSYNRAISKVVAYIFEGLTGYSFPEQVVSDEIVFLFRRSGGFNNDWDTVYGILMFTLSSLPNEIRGIIKERIEAAGWQHDPFERFSLMKEAAKKDRRPEILNNEFFEGLIGKLKEFTELLDASGTGSVDESLVGVPGVREEFVDFFNILKRFLHFPAEVGQSMIATVFEEFFCGSNLFRQTFKIRSRFRNGLGMIENERLIIRPETLDHLTSIVGEANLGVASGSRLRPARHILGDLLECFNPEALVFLEVIEENERLRSSQEGLKVNLKKPRPFSLLKAAEAFGSFNYALYVGDSMEDAITAREARNLDGRFLFGGVYRYSSLEDAVLEGFLESGCDLVVPSVNELPIALETLRRERI